MCLVFVSVKQHPKYKLVIAANRDEFYARKTAPAHFWSDHPEIVGGRDLEANGTWLGVSTKGRVALVTNFRDLRNLKKNAPSRGQLVTDALLTDQPADAYLHTVMPRAHAYNGFNLIAGTVDDLWYYSNFSTGITKLETGSYGLSNHLLDTPWPKVRLGKEAFNRIIAGDFTPDDLFTMLHNHDVAGDDELPDTGVGLELERVLSAMFIKSPGYGTRSSSVVLADYEGNVFFTERVFDPGTLRFTDNNFTFQL